jgi:transposase
VRYRKMSEKQLLVYGARLRLAWFRKAEELGNVAEACRFYGIPRRTYYYWYKRWLENNKQLICLYDLPRTPKSHPKDLGGDKVSLIVALRIQHGYGEKALEYILKRDYGISIGHHGIGNVLKRAEITKPRPRKARTHRQLNDYPYKPGEVGQMDVKHWKKVAYQYDLVDCATRIKYKRLYPGYSPAYTIDFLEHALRFFDPAFSFEGIQTDNGGEFVYDQKPQIKLTTISPVTLWLEAHNIKHLRIPPRSPHLNGRNERPHGVDKYRYKHLTTNSHNKAELQEFLTEDCWDYNFYRPHSMLKMMTPIEYLQSLPGFEHATLDTSVLYV